MDFSADCTILTAMISRVQSYEKLKSNFPAVLHHLENDTLMYVTFAQTHAGNNSPQPPQGVTRRQALTL